MIIWSRGGILAPVAAILSLVLTEYSVNALFNSEIYYEVHGWPKFVALSIAGLLCFLLGRFLNKEEKVYIDKATGKDVVLKIFFFYLSLLYHFPLIFQTYVLYIL